MSNPEAKEAVWRAICQHGPQTACSRYELKMKLGLGHLSMTQFWAALRSLNYKPGERRVRLSQPRDYVLGTRMVNVVPL